MAKTGLNDHAHGGPQTILLDSGYSRILVTDSQLKVPIDTMIMTATSAAIGIWRIKSSRNTTRMIRQTPATSVDRRVRPPDFTLITDCPIIAQPAMPPTQARGDIGNALALALAVFVAGRIRQIIDNLAVIKDSASPRWPKRRRRGR